MSDADYHEGYFEGIRNASWCFNRILNIDDYREWLLSELDDAKRIRDEFKRDE